MPQAVSAKKIVLKAPFTGYLLPITEVPDPVFSQKMVGDGISIDPVTNCLLAPCRGEISQLHSANHAVTIATDDGIEVMIHIGLETVMLKGEGFKPLVKKGDKVKAGDALIEFDMDIVATKAASLLTQIVITNSDQVAKFQYAEGPVEANRDTVLTLHLGEYTESAAAAPSETVTTESFLIPNPSGLHARPAAVLSSIAKKYKSAVHLHKGDQQANAKSVVAIMGLDVGNNEIVYLSASGEDAEAALAEVKNAMLDGLGEKGAEPVKKKRVPHGVKPLPETSNDPNLLCGVSASPGLAHGFIVQKKQQQFDIPERGEAPAIERQMLQTAIEHSKQQLLALQHKMAADGDAENAKIFEAHCELLDDPDLLDIANDAIDQSKSAAFAWQGAVNTHVKVLSSLSNDLMAQRANDLRDVGRRVLSCLLGEEESHIELPENAILVAEDLTPSDTANLDRSKVIGLCTVLGGTSSHAAIIARSLDVPYVAGLNERLLEVANNTPAILDGGKGELRLNPDQATIDEAIARKKAIAKKRQADLAAANDPAVTTDGHRIEVAANIGNEQEAVEAVKMGGEGVGLLRSEFLYLDRTTEPSEEDQFTIYSNIANTLGKNRPLIIRTLDVGGDKPLPYLRLPDEENPFLGQRGIRIGLAYPDILRTQIRAILKAANGCKMRIMFPMIANLDELRQAKAMIREEQEKLNVGSVEIGIMVEVPVTAVMAEQFAREVDFFSIGTNDLTQYTLAMDRGHPELAAKIDSLHPGILRLVKQTVEGAHQHGKWVGVCGAVASDPQAVPLLVGLGVDELSVSVPCIPEIKAQIRGLKLADCQQLAEKALNLESAAEVRKINLEK